MSYLERGTLPARVRAATAHARACGKLASIATDYELVEQAGVRFVVRVLSALDRKEAVTRMQRAAGDRGEAVNPFLPYDADLHVADLSDTHVCLLNKFNVVEHHLLIVTRVFEDQRCVLTLADFEAWWQCLDELDGLGFYNAGATAGASQPHKHMQMVPLPLAPVGPPIPIAPLLAEVAGDGRVAHLSALPFAHAVVRLGTGGGGSRAERARESLEAYRGLLEALGLRARDGHMPDPYNLLLTREWMLLVPRACECFESVSVNALGFAGALLVRNEDGLATVKRCGPMNLLARVALPRENNERLTTEDAED